jgi:hypothetical protein
VRNQPKILADDDLDRLGATEGQAVDLVHLELASKLKMLVPVFSTGAIMWSDGDLHFGLFCHLLPLAANLA